MYVGGLRTPPAPLQQKKVRLRCTNALLLQISAPAQEEAGLWPGRLFRAAARTAVGLKFKTDFEGSGRHNPTTSQTKRDVKTSKHAVNEIKHPQRIKNQEKRARSGSPSSRLSAPEIQHERTNNFCHSNRKNTFCCCCLTHVCAACTLVFPPGSSSLGRLRQQKKAPLGIPYAGTHSGISRQSSRKP